MDPTSPIKLLPPKKNPTSCICEYMLILRKRHINKLKILFILI
jgi:hypothetical protein